MHTSSVLIPTGSHPTQLCRHHPDLNSEIDGRHHSEVIKSAIDGTFVGGTYVGNLANGGVALAPFHNLESMFLLNLLQNSNCQSWHSCGEVESRSCFHKVPNN